MAAIDYKAPEPLKGVVLGFFSPDAKGKQGTIPSHAMVVNLDYKLSASVGIRGSKRLELFDAAAGQWRKAGGKRVELQLPPGGGKLVRIRP